MQYVVVLMFFLHGIATATITYTLVCTGVNSFYMGINILQLTHALYCSCVVVIVVHAWCICEGTL